MDNNVIIKISGLQVVEDTGDQIEIIAPAKYYIKNNKHYLLYEEIDDQNGASTKNTIKFQDTMAEVIRKGAVNGRLVFDKERNIQSIYSTPFGELLLEIMTNKIKLTVQEEQINLKIDYELYVNNSKVSDSKIEISVSNAQQ